MPFLAWMRSKSDRPNYDWLRGELNRLLADPRVHRLMEWFSRHEQEIAGVQLGISAVPAPPFAEQERAAWLGERFQALGLDVSTDAEGNLLALRPPSPSAPAGQAGEAEQEAGSVAISAHLDTIFPAGTPLDIRREHTQLRGPGICDNGAGLAALWAVAAALQELEIPTLRPLLFVANVGEEGEGNLRGMRHLYREQISALAGTEAPGDPAAAPAIAQLIALDGAGTASIVSQALGSRRYEIVITGCGGHSWSDYGTPNPIVAAALAVRQLSRIPLPAHPRTTLNVGTIEGGTSVNAIPSRASFKVDLRSMDARRLDDLEQQLRGAVADACREARSNSSPHQLEHTIVLTGERPPGELPESSPLLAAICAIDARLGIQAQPQRASTDANIPLSLGLEAISLGCGGNGGGAHTLQEWFDPAGRELGLKRIALLALLLAGVPETGEEPGEPATRSQSSARSRPRQKS